jgi:hypothetical protein
MIERTAAGASLELKGASSHASLCLRLCARYRHRLVSRESGREDRDESVVRTLDNRRRGPAPRNWEGPRHDNSSYYWLRH